MTAATPTSFASPAAWHGVDCSESRPAARSLSPDRRGQLKNGNRAGDFLAAPPLQRPHPLRRRMPPARHAQWSLPPSWRPQHRPSYRRRSRPLPPRPLEARRPLCRAPRPPAHGPSAAPPHPRLPRPTRWGLRWAWGSSSDVTAEHHRRSSPFICGKAFFSRWAWSPSLLSRPPVRIGLVQRHPPCAKVTRPNEPLSGASRWRP